MSGARELPRLTFRQQQEQDFDRLCAAAGANLARYVYDDRQCRGRCHGHDRGQHHPLCSALAPDCPHDRTAPRNPADGGRSGFRCLDCGAEVRP